ncbi:MAG TPA: EscU/YscU/HrcU family type III secretion system export apparatus switch protein [Pirellulaceae bacterium]|nr:EscU/YscU/HrcU family type III secretion system export apparatus switch protein [Pirellulaceae bacterium]
MAEEFGDKTHEATPYRRQKAREEGQVVKSQDLASAAVLLAAVLVLWYFGRGLADFMADLLREHLGGQAWLTIDSRTSSYRLLQVGAGLGKYLLPILGLFVLAAILVQLGQVGFLYLPEKLALDAKRINPLTNVGRIFSLTSAVHLGFGLVKVALILLVAGWSLWGERFRMMGLVDHSAAEIAGYLLDVTLWTCLKIAAALVILALLDYGYLFWKHERDLRMTTQEMREELKQQQGDPQIAARRKQVQRQLVLNRLASSVPKADVVVTNPTELAIALQYDHEKMAAPIVIAKGAGILAQRIRRLALENSVPVVERKELAQALYKFVDINHPVPSEQYAAVAEVIRYVYQLKGKKLPAATAA